MHDVAGAIHAELMRITQVFSVRWVFSSFRAIKAFICDYASLCRHLTQCAEDNTRSGKERAKCSGFAKKLREWNFVAKLLLLADVLEVLWTLSAYIHANSKCFTSWCSAKDRSCNEDVENVEGTARRQPQHIDNKWKMHDKHFKTLLWLQATIIFRYGITCRKMNYVTLHCALKCQFWLLKYLKKANTKYLA